MLADYVQPDHPLAVSFMLILIGLQYPTQKPACSIFAPSGTKDRYFIDPYLHLVVRSMSPSLSFILSQLHVPALIFLTCFRLTRLDPWLFLILLFHYCHCAKRHGPFILDR